mmetsp:Transcript_42254/g.111741  ORF Transcript_42254/g.111741 Transcript_42254/m.111741 type:complete len:202 (+) Transcript_42254:434-1039(+)
MSARQRHVVDLVRAPQRLPDAELHGEVLHVGGLLAASIDLGVLHSELGGDARVHVVAGVQEDVAEAVLGGVELQRACVPQVLAPHELLVLRVQVVLHGDVHTPDLRHVLGAERRGGPRAPVAEGHQRELHKHVLLKGREAVVALQLPPVHEELVVRDHALVRHINEAVALPLVVEVHRAGIPRVRVDLEAGGHRLRGISGP